MVKAYKNRRRILEFRHDGQSWFLREKQLRLDTYTGLPKRDALKWARQFCRAVRDKGLLVQLRIFNRDGRIASESTYGKDPKRRVG